MQGLAPLSALAGLGARGNRLTSLASAVRALFANGEQGALYLPSDFSRYMAAGTDMVPVKIGGNDATYDTASASASWAHTSYAAIGLSTVQSGEWYEISGVATNVGGHNITVNLSSSFPVLASVDGPCRVVVQIPAGIVQLPIYSSTYAAGNVDPATTLTNLRIRKLTGIATCSLYQDAAGTTPVTAVEQPVGLMLDGRFGLARGAERIANGGFADATGWTIVQPTSGSITISGGVMRVNSVDGSACWAYYAGACEANKTYEVTFDILATTGGGVRIDGPGYVGTAFNTIGPKRVVFTSTGAGSLQITRGGGICDTTIDNVSAKEIPGNHATQSTAAARPVLSARVNQLPCSNLATATVGTIGAGGALPLGWGWSAVAGITKQVLAKGTLPDGRAYCDFRVSGTNTSGGTGYQDLYFCGNSVLVSAVSGQTWVAAVTLQQLAGDAVTGFTNANRRIFNAEFNGSSFVNASNAATNISVAETRHVVARVFNQATTTNARVAFDLTVSAGATIDLSFRVIEPQLELGTAATRYQRVNTATDYDTVGFPLYLKFDGVDDCMVTSSGGAWGDFSVTGAVAYTSFASVPLFYSSRLGLAGHQIGALATPAYSFQGGNGSTFLGGSISGTPVAGVACIHTGIFDGISSNFQRANGVDLPTGTAAWTDPPNDGFKIGGRDDAATNWMTGNIYGLAVLSRQYSTAERASTERFFANLAGVTLP